jgi:hypothetical protein
MRPGKSAGKKGDAGMRAIGVRLRDGVGSSGGGLAAGAAVPDTNGLTLHSVLAAELAHVAGVLCDLEAIVSGLSESVLRGACSWASTHFHLLDLLTERGTVTGTILSGDSDLLGACVSGSILRSGGQRGVGRRTFRHFGGVVRSDGRWCEVRGTFNFELWAAELSGNLAPLTSFGDARPGSTRPDRRCCPNTPCTTVFCVRTTTRWSAIMEKRFHRLTVRESPSSSSFSFVPCSCATPHLLTTSPAPAPALPSFPVS